MLPRGLLKEYSRLIALILRGLDISSIIIAGWIAYFYKFANLTYPQPYQIAFIIAGVAVPVVFNFFSIYHSMRGGSLWSHLQNLTHAVCVLFLFLAVLAFLTKSGENFSRSWFLIWFGLAWLLIILSRISLVSFLRFMRSNGWNERHVVIVGAGNLGLRFAETIQQALWTGYRIIAVFDDVATQESRLGNLTIRKTPENLSDYIAKNNVDELWMALPLSAIERVKEILHSLRHKTITTRYVLDIFGLDLLNHSIAEIAGFPVLNLRSSPMTGVNRIVKAIEDRLLAALILIFVSPLLIVIAAAVKLSSRGPIFYKQKRVSWNGKEFNMLKFRTMPIDAESKTGPVWAQAGEHRATRIGGILRRLSLDELPQFINVLKGDMSIVGPRPERSVFVEEFKDKIPGYMQKHFVKAGITGWAQINGWRGNTSLEKRIECDLYYIQNWSLMFDLKIILLTLLHGFINKNAY